MTAPPRKEKGGGGIANYFTVQTHHLAGGTESEPSAKPVKETRWSGRNCKGKYLTRKAGPQALLKGEGAGIRRL